jgi:hypothetical protein
MFRKILYRRVIQSLALGLLHRVIQSERNPEKKNNKKYSKII